jgi:hypothetical protein
MPAHEQDHVGHHDHGNGADDGLEALLLALRQLGGDDLEDYADGDADGDGHRHTDPHLAQGIASSLLTEEGRHDADDEGGFQPLS